MSKIAALIAGIVLGSALPVGAATTNLLPFKAAGVLCYFGNGPQGRGTACGLGTGRGYGVTVTNRKVLVWDVKTAHVIYVKAQP